MAITILATPDRVHPGYNPIYYYVDSTNKNLPGFRYIFQIKLCNSPYTVLRELKIAPRPGDGYGYADLSKIIQDYLTNAFDVGNNTYINADQNSVFEYQVDFGEEYIESYELYTAFSAGATGSFANQTFISGTTSMPFIVGDQVYIDIDSGYIDCRAGIEGFWTITSAAPGIGLLTVNYNTFCVGSQNITGSFIRYADNRRVRTVGLSSSTCGVAFNRAYSFLEFAQYSEDDIICVDNNSQILTNAPNDNFYIYPWQNLWWNFFDDITNNVGTILFENPDGTIFILDTCALGTIPYIKQVDVSPSAAAIYYSGPGTFIGEGGSYTVTAVNNCLCGFPESLTIIYDEGSGTVVQDLIPSGVYDGFYFYIFFGSTTIWCLWYDSGSTAYVVTDSLGSTAVLAVQGNVAPGSPPYVPVGTTTGGEWIPQAPWTNFETKVCVPDLTVANFTSQTKKIYIQDRCPINETQIVFMDRAGSWSSFAFSLREKKSITSEKKNYRKEFGNLDQSLTPDKWRYFVDEAGEVTYSVTTEKTLTLQTDWMSGEMSQYFQELVTSPECYLKSQDETANKHIRVIVLNNSMEIQRSKNKKLINYTIQVKFAVNENINI